MSVVQKIGQKIRLASWKKQTYAVIEAILEKKILVRMYHSLGHCEGEYELFDDCKDWLLVEEPQECNHKFKDVYFTYVSDEEGYFYKICPGCKKRFRPKSKKPKTLLAPAFVKDGFGDWRATTELFCNKLTAELHCLATINYDAKVVIWPAPQPNAQGFYEIEEEG